MLLISINMLLFVIDMLLFPIDVCSFEPKGCSCRSPIIHIDRQPCLPCCFPCFGYRTPSRPQFNKFRKVRSKERKKEETLHAKNKWLKILTRLRFPLLLFLSTVIELPRQALMIECAGGEEEEGAVPLRRGSAWCARTASCRAPGPADPAGWRRGRTEIEEPRSSGLTIDMEAVVIDLGVRVGGHAGWGGLECVRFISIS